MKALIILIILAMILLTGCAGNNQQTDEYNQQPEPFPNSNLPPPETTISSNEIEITGTITIVSGLPMIDVFTDETWTEQLREIDFGEVGAGGVSGIQTLYVANTGTTTIRAEVILLTDISSWGQLSISPGPDDPPEAHILLPGRYTPYNLQFTINSDAPAGTQTYKIIVRGIQET